MKAFSTSAFATICVAAAIQAVEQSDQRFNFRNDHFSSSIQTRATSTWDVNSLEWFFDSPANYPVISYYDLSDRDNVLNLADRTLLPAKIKEQIGRTVEITEPAPSYWKEDYGVEGKPFVRKIIFADGVITETGKRASMYSVTSNGVKKISEMVVFDTSKVYYDNKGRITGSWSKTQTDSLNGKLSSVYYDSSSYSYSHVTGKIEAVQSFRKTDELSPWTVDDYATFSLQYDAHGRLTSAEAIGNSSYGLPITYSYDEQGNLVSAGATKWVYKDNLCVKQIDTTESMTSNGVTQATGLRTTTYEYTDGKVTKGIDSTFSFVGSEWKLDYATPMTISYDSQGRAVKFENVSEFETEAEEISYDNAGNLINWSGSEYNMESLTPYSYQGIGFVYEGGLPIYWEEIEYEGSLPYTNPAMATTREKVVFAWSGPGVGVAGSSKIGQNIGLTALATSEGIRVTIPGVSRVEMSLVSLNGRTVAKINPIASAEGVSAVFSTGSLGIARGVYILNAKVNGLIQNMRIVLP